TECRNENLHTNLLIVLLLFFLGCSLKITAFNHTKCSRNTGDSDQNTACKRRQPLTKCNNDTQCEPEQTGWQEVFIGFYDPCTNTTIHAEETGKKVHDLYQFIGDSVLRT